MWNRIDLHEQLWFQCVLVFQSTKGILFLFSYKFAHVTLCIRLLHSIIKYVNQPLCHDLYGHTLRQLKRKDIAYPRNNINISSSSLIRCISDRGIQVCCFNLIMHMTHNSKNGFVSRNMIHYSKHAGACRGSQFIFHNECS